MKIEPIQRVDSALISSSVQGVLSSVTASSVAYQPIVSTTSLRTHGFEALARLPANGEFESVHALMDEASKVGLLRAAERLLIKGSINSFARFSGAGATRLFCNVDNRVFDDPGTNPGEIIQTILRAGLQPANLCIEISERQPPNSTESLGRIVDVFLKHNVRIAIDDFGQGFSGLDMLMRVNPHYVKIDRAFIDGVSASPRKQAIVNKVAGLAHSLGLLVVAEGVEEEADFRMVRALGCDFAQGYLIARPTTQLTELSLQYGRSAGPRAATNSIPPPVSDMITFVRPICISDPFVEAIRRFKSGSVSNILPVVDEHGYVHGAIFEADVRPYLFGDFGSALLANKGLNHNLARYVRRCPISEATVPTETLVDSYVVAAGSLGLVLTLDGRYAGVLGNHEVLRLAAAREVAAARDQNPLTSLPGNNSITRHIDEVLGLHGPRTLAFFDLDNFKVFNDSYGFSAGDRALVMFSDLLLKYRHEKDLFVGHIGGDDFFMSIPADLTESERVVSSLCLRFRQDAEGLYQLHDRAAGGLWAKDRFGKERFFPLLRASVSLLPLPDGRFDLDAATIIATLSKGKALAKQSASGMAVVTHPCETREVEPAGRRNPRSQAE